MIPSPSLAQLVGPACYTVTDWLLLGPVNQLITKEIDSVKVMLPIP